MIDDALRVVETGWTTTIQDLGRPGMAHLGVPRAGAVDRRAQSLANRIVGNQPHDATIETGGGLVVEAIRPLIVGTSADGSRHTLQAGDRLSVDPVDEVWAYLAVRGGIEIEPVLGSRSHDTLCGLGPPLLADGTRLAVGDDPQSDLVTDHAPLRRPVGPVRLWEGPRESWLSRGIAAVADVPWTVTSEISRVGVRLTGSAVDRIVGDGARVPSEGLVEGAIQVTPAGELIVMLANHPTTGGYPVIAVVDPDDLVIIVQSRPGSIIRFRRWRG